MEIALKRYEKKLNKALFLLAAMEKNIDPVNLNPKTLAQSLKRGRFQRKRAHTQTVTRRKEKREEEGKN